MSKPKTYSLGSILFVLFMGFLVGMGLVMLIQIPTGVFDVNHGEPRGYLDSGIYKIVSVVEVHPDHALLVLRDVEKPNSEPRYHKIDADETINFEIVSLATHVVRVVDGPDGLTYTKFLVEVKTQ